MTNRTVRHVMPSRGLPNRHGRVVGGGNSANTVSAAVYLNFAV